jgi:hypothetical protein
MLGVSCPIALQGIPFAALTDNEPASSSGLEAHRIERRAEGLRLRRRADEFGQVLQGDDDGHVIRRSADELHRAIPGLAENRAETVARASHRERRPADVDERLEQAGLNVLPARMGCAPDPLHEPFAHDDLLMR